ncbi:unnamed protein product [Adineta ricciae]|uniref:Uncharacterized protein n=1 Tax=Adineta ricciae TaxID=249248 RepID=A0A813VDN9_ADIRI|nr:unnamed protein product [Adineta ricciae]CAF0835182.1 unnamed protein product [Adineta ricciae]
MMITISVLFIFLLMSFAVPVDSQICKTTSAYEECSGNGACGCFPMAGANNIGICAFLWQSCDELQPCGPSLDCSDSDHICVHHTRCADHPVCYPLAMAEQDLCPSMQSVKSTTTTSTSTVTTMNSVMPGMKFEQHGTIVAGGKGGGESLDQLSVPIHIFVDEKKTMFITDEWNHRIVEWKYNENNGRVVAGGNGLGDRINQLAYPTSAMFDQQSQSLIIADRDNRRIVQWFNDQNQRVLIENIDCFGLAMDKYGYLYVSDTVKNEVRQWTIGEKEGALVAGGNGQGSQLNQFSLPTYLFVDEKQSVYVSDYNNHRVMKWLKGARKGYVVAGGNGRGGSVNELFHPQGLFVDLWNQIYIADWGNHRVMRWREGDQEGEIVVGENGEGNETNQVYGPYDVACDLDGNLYVSEYINRRVMRFDLKQSDM